MLKRMQQNGIKVSISCWSDLKKAEVAAIGNIVLARGFLNMDMSLMRIKP
jgi:hypothetical protein